MENLIDTEEWKQKENSSTSEEDYHSTEDTETDTTATETEMEDQDLIPDSYPPCGQTTCTSTPQLNLNDVKEMKERVCGAE